MTKGRVEMYCSVSLTIAIIKVQYWDHVALQHCPTALSKTLAYLRPESSRWEVRF